MNSIYEDSKFQDWNLEREYIASYFKNKNIVSIREFLVGLFFVYCTKLDSKDYLFGIKKGSYIFYWRSIRALFPEAKFVCLIRDGRAVFNSKKKSIYSKTGEPFEKSPVHAAVKWKNKIHEIRKLEEELPDNTLVVLYEDIMKDYDQMLAKISEFLGASRNAQYHMYALPDKYSNLHPHIDSPPKLEHINKWENELCDNEIVAFETIAHQELQKNGYRLKSNKIERLTIRCRLQLKKFLRNTRIERT